MARGSGSSRRSKTQRRRLGKVPRIILGGFLLAGFGLAVMIFFNPFVWRLNLRAELEKSKIASTVYDRNGQVVANLYAKTRVWVPLREIPPEVQEAFVATEDYRFYQHKGIDVHSIIRAIYLDLKTGRKVQGGSTITQQLTKNLFFTQEKRFTRKIWEMAYAIRIEQQYSKAQILEFYLNSIYMGHGAWGVSGAAEVYFGKAVRALNINEAALLAALARSPEYYSPFRHPKATEKRRNLVLRLMQQHGYLKAARVAGLSREPLKFLAQPGGTFIGGYFSDYVVGVLTEATGRSEAELRSGGYTIYTSMERQIQASAEAALQLLPVAGPDRWGIAQPQGSIVVLEPRTGEILALVGGRRFSSAEVNRAVGILRQPGSAIKPFLYAAALEAGYTPETRVVDQPLELTVNGAPWRPQNFDYKYRGEITLREALEESINTVAVQLVQNLGPSNVFALGKQMGLEHLVAEGAYNDLGPAPLALGGLTKGVTLLELTSAYTGFANQGIYSRPFGIYRAYDHRGRLIYRSGLQQRQVILAKTAETMTSMLEGVVLRGTGIRANVGVKAAGKTGTSNRNTNGWFIGYTPSLLAGVWIGNDRADQALVVNGLALGSGTAAAIWGGLMARLAARAVAVGQDWPRPKRFE